MISRDRSRDIHLNDGYTIAPSLGLFNARSSFLFLPYLPIVSASTSSLVLTCPTLRLQLCFGSPLTITGFWPTTQDINTTIKSSDNKGKSLPFLIVMIFLLFGSFESRFQYHLKPVISCFVSSCIFLFESTVITGPD